MLTSSEFRAGAVRGTAWAGCLSFLFIAAPGNAQIPFTAAIEFDEYAFPPATTDGGIVVQGPDDSFTEAYNLLDDATGDKLISDNGDSPDFTFTYTAGVSGALGLANRPDLRFRVSGAAGSQITGRTGFSGAVTANNPGTRQYYELRVTFAEHLDVQGLSLDFSSLNTAGIAWEYSEISFLDRDGAYFSDPPVIETYADFGSGQTGNTAPGHYLMALTNTVDDVGTDQTAPGVSNPPADGPTILDEVALGISGQSVGGFVWRTTLEDVRGTGNGNTNFSSSLRAMTLSGTLIAPPQSIQANDDSYGPVDGVSGDDDLGSVLDNDLIDDKPVSPELVTLEAKDELPDGISLDTSTGTVGVLPGTPPGVYVFDYEICATEVMDLCGSATVDVTVEGNPAIEVVKTHTTVPEFPAPPIVVGSELFFEVFATNTGDVPLNDVVVRDEMLSPSEATCPLLQPGEMCTLAGIYTVTQGDADAGEVHNTATAQGAAPDGSVVEGEASITITIPPPPLPSPIAVPMMRGWGLILLSMLLVLLAVRTMPGRYIG